MPKLQNYFAQKSVKVTLSLLLIIGGFTVYAFFDRFTYFPILLILIGIIGAFFSFIKLKNALFYLPLLFLLYILLSVQHEVYKVYYLTIHIPKKSSKIYFVVSNPSLKWKDYLLTWFSSEKIQIDLSHQTVIYLTRGIPNNIVLNSKNNYDKQYSTLTIFGRHRDFIVIKPIRGNKLDLNKEEFSESYSDSLSNIISESDENLFKHKIDLLEKN